jgi:hypothetical protein
MALGFLAQGAQPDVEALRAAVSGKNPACVNLILQSVRPNGDDLLAAAASGVSEVFEAILAALGGEIPPEPVDPESQDFWERTERPGEAGGGLI